MAYQTIANWCLNCATSDLPNDDLFKQLMLQAACSIIAGGGGGGGGGGVVAVESCRVITDAGAWGNPGDIINDIRFFNTAVLPPEQVGQIFINETTGETVEGVDGTNSEVCPEDALGADCATSLFVKTCAGDAANGALVSSSVTGASTVTAGKWSVSIVNVGNANGTVDGQPLLPGETFNATGYITQTGSLTQTMYLPAVTMDGTGTTLRVRTFV